MLLECALKKTQLFSSYGVQKNRKMDGKSSSSLEEEEDDVLDVGGGVGVGLGGDEDGAGVGLGGSHEGVGVGLGGAHDGANVGLGGANVALGGVHNGG